jgi:hypothetical protein
MDEPAKFNAAMLDLVRPTVAHETSSDPSGPQRH